MINALLAALKNKTNPKTTALARLVLADSPVIKCTCVCQNQWDQSEKVAHFL